MRTRHSLFGTGLALLVLGSIHLRPVLGAEVSLELISRALGSVPTSGGDSGEMVFSADGQWAVFVSSGDGLVPNDHNGLNLDVFLRNQQTGEITLVSHTPSGVSDSGDSTFALISDDGRSVVFQSDAPDLAPGDQNGGTDVFAYDTETGQVRMLSQTDEAGISGETSLVAISSDARFVLLQSDADDLVPRDTNEAADLFLLDRDNGSRTLVTKAWNSSAPASFGDTLRPALGPSDLSMSADGRFVAYLSAATNLVSSVPANLSGLNQLYLWDRLTGTNRLISAVTSTNLADKSSASNPVLSRTGAELAFLADEAYLRTNIVQRLYVFQLGSGVLDAVPVPPEYAAGVQLSFEEPAFDASGEHLAYVLGSQAESEDQVYLYDLAARSNRLVSRSPGGERGNSASATPVISSDGRVVVFESAASNLTADPVTGDVFQLFAFDVASGEIRLLSRALGGAGGADRDILFPTISPDGQAVAFTSFARNLVVLDDPQYSELFIAPTSGAGPVSLVSTGLPSNISATANGSSELGDGALSVDGRYLVFRSEAANLVPNDTNGMADLFLRDLWSGGTRLVSIPPAEGAPLQPADLRGLSLNGRTILYSIFHEAGGSNRFSLFAYDVPSGTTHLASLDPEGQPGAADYPSLSADGRYVGFVSGGPVLRVRDLWTETTSTVPGLAMGEVPRISASGRYFLIFYVGKPYALIDRLTGERTSIPRAVFAPEPAFSLDDRSLFLARTPSGSAMSSLVEISLPAFATNVLATNILTPFFISADGTVALYQRIESDASVESVLLDIPTGRSKPLTLDGASLRVRSAAFSADGRFFVLAVPNSLVAPGQSDEFSDIYLYDRVLANLTLVSRNVAGMEANGPSGIPSVSADGRVIAFETLATDLGVTDLNRLSDIFVAHVTPVDANANGLEDGWERLNFQGVADPSGDDDNDGVSNLEEFRAGTDPHDGHSAFALAPLVRTMDNGLRLEWPVVLGRTYQVQHKERLSDADWLDLGAPQTGLGSASVSFEVSAENASGFYRLKAL